jgi:hypothetical protein
MLTADLARLVKAKEIDRSTQEGSGSGSRLHSQYAANFREWTVSF